MGTTAPRMAGLLGERANATGHVFSLDQIVVSREEQIAFIRERYEACVVRQDGCWDWIGTVHGGYGQLKVLGTTISAHRLSWMLYRGHIPVGLRVLHHCDNPPCSNPDHLFVGTQKDNMRDMSAKDRSGATTNHYSAKLTIPQVRLIQREAKVGPIRSARRRELAAEFGVTASNIWMVATGRTWRLFDGEAE